MIKNRFALSGAALLAAWLIVPGCSVERGPDDAEAVGTAQAAITNVPIDGSVACIAITTTGSWTDTQSFDVSPGQSSVFTLSGIPIGTVRFEGAAYASACAQVTPSSLATWVSSPVLASVVPGQITTVTLDMHPAGSSNVGVDFDGEPACRADGLPCFGPSECCSGSCVNNTCDASAPVCPPGTVDCGGVCADLMFDPLNCGACGSVCPPATFCQFGACFFGGGLCGDGVVQPGEQCDDGNLFSGDGCSVMCDVEPGVVCFGQPSVCVSICGDGIVGLSEQCDDGNTTNGDGCDNTCTLESSCTNALKDGTETDVDCGGPSCPKCVKGLSCAANADCVTGLCTAGVCSDASCVDGIKNGTETDVDCGGACAPCASGKACATNVDCLSGFCFAGLCF